MDDWDKYQYEENREQNKTVYYDTADAPKRAPKEKKEPSFVTRKAFVITLIACMVLSAAVGAGAYALAMSHFGGAVIDKTISTTNYNLAKATGSELSVQEIIAKNENSVVAISTESVATDSWLRQYVTKGAGSGVIYSEDGYIITNNHVIDGANSINVTLYDGTQCDASLVATDEQTDIAVIKIDKKGLTPVTIGTMDNLSVGDLAVAIGNPLGTLSGTATEGIISALEREITLEGKSMTLIQTSASINPGNSGGALFNMDGQVIGINSSKIASTEYEGMGFAIPSNTAVNTANSLIQNGYVAGRAKLGITYVPISNVTNAQQVISALAEKGFKNAEGAMVINEISSDSDLANKDVKQYDMIVAVNGDVLTSTDVMTSVLSKSSPGDTVKLTIARIENNSIKTFEVECKLIESKE